MAKLVDYKWSDFDKKYSNNIINSYALGTVCRCLGLKNVSITLADRGGYYSWKEVSKQIQKLI